MKKRLIPIIALALVVVMSIGITAYQFGHNSQTINSFRLDGYIYTTSSTTVEAETVASEPLSSVGITYIFARIVGEERVEKRIPAFAGHIAVTASASGDTSSFGNHGGSEAGGEDFDFDTPY